MVIKYPMVIPSGIPQRPRKKICFFRFISFFILVTFLFFYFPFFFFLFARKTCHILSLFLNEIYDASQPQNFLDFRNVSSGNVSHRAVLQFDTNRSGETQVKIADFS